MFNVIEAVKDIFTAPKNPSVSPHKLHQSARHDPHTRTLLYGDAVPGSRIAVLQEQWRITENPQLRNQIESDINRENSRT